MQNHSIPDPNAVYANAYGTTCFIRNVVRAPNIQIGEYTYYDDADGDPTAFEQNNVLYNWPEFGDKLVIGKFCAIAQGTRFVMGPANHRISSVSSYPFAVLGGAWQQRVPPHMAQLPQKGDTVVGNDVWIGRECLIMPGARIGDGAIIAARSVVAGRIEPYTIAGGNPARPIRRRFGEALARDLLALRWWDFEPQALLAILPTLCDTDLERAHAHIRALLAQRGESL